MNAFTSAFDLIRSGDKLLTNIVFTTLEMAFASSIISLLLGGIIGLFVASYNFRGKSIVVLILRTLMGLPPVVVGIVVYVLFSGTGPFGKYQLIYSLELMIIAQIVLITPIVAGMTESSITPLLDRMRPTLMGMNMSLPKRLGLSISESKYQYVAIYLFAFARAISEVGAIQIVGGNILNKTRTMTTAIALNYNTGDFELAIALGIILLLIALCVNLVASLLQLGMKKRYD